mmetsp:Transcript_629/g.1645  ORF Transcript_629/g.1645 Transcript_629/m.1645 type:complete len:174 (+) Transcript_629:805-1326(+)
MRTYGNAILVTAACLATCALSGANEGFETVAVRNLLQEPIVAHIVWKHPNKEFGQVETLQAAQLSACKSQKFGAIVAMPFAAQDSKTAAWGNYMCTSVCIYHDSDPVRRCFGHGTNESDAESIDVNAKDKQVFLTVQKHPDAGAPASSGDEGSASKFEIKPVSWNQWSKASCA